MKKPLVLLSSLATLLTTSSLAQTSSSPDQRTNEGDETIVLSPFVVSSTEDQGRYKATSTLAGTRVRTDLADVASAISVVTAEFLRDTGATNNQSLLQYTTNAEVGGVYGNFAGVGSTFINGISEKDNFVRPSANTRIRGLDSADNTRDFFQSDIPWDSYNVGRVDIQRGPNSILFGLGSPAGIINASINTAGFRDAYRFENRVGSYGSMRNSVDLNHVLLKNELALRLAVLDDNTKFKQEPAFRHDRRIFAAANWQKNLKLFGDDSAKTTLRANFENGDIRSNQPRVLPPEDRISAFFDPGAINKQTWDPAYAWTYGVLAQEPIKITPIGEKVNYWVAQGTAGVSEGANPVFIYDNTTGRGGSPIQVRQGQGAHYWGLNSAGVRDGNFGGTAFYTSLGIHGYGSYTANANQYDSMLFPGASAGLYKDRALTDTSVFDFLNNLIDGPNKREWQDWNAYNVSLEQSFLNNRLAVQLVYDYQDYRDGAERNMDNPFVTVDINKYTLDYPGIVYTAENGYSAPYLATLNPNAGRAFVGGAGSGQARFTQRENFRATLTGELAATDFLNRSLLTRVLGRHVFTALYSDETYQEESRNWSRYGMDYTWSNAIGQGPNGSGTDAQSGWGSRKPAWKMYLSDPLFNRSSAAGLNLQPITTLQSPAGNTSIWWEDSHWKRSLNPLSPDYVDPATPWTWPGLGGSVNKPGTESENAANYVGWSYGAFDVKNADQGDLDQLYTDLSKVRKKTTSEALTWQAYLWDDILVGTVGWRRDREERRSGAGEFNSALGYVPLGFDLAPESSVATGNSVSWGLVAHVSKLLRRKLPYGSQVSLFFNKGKNSRVESRYGFDGMALPNAKGTTTDYGVILSTLDGRLQFKTTFYKTRVQDANIASITTETSTLGAVAANVHSYEAVGTAVALTNVAGFAGDPAAPNWYWNYALVDDNAWGDPAYDDPNGPKVANHPSTIKEKAAIDAWLAQMPAQAWFDAFGYQVDVAKAKAKDYRNAIVGFGWNGYVGVFAAGAGRINGAWPTGTVNNESKGVEFELLGQIQPNWNVSINASKQHASQTALGASLSEFIEQQHAKFEGPAGDLRLWWGGDLPIRDYYKPVWAAYQFQKQTNGKMVPEMSPWRANVVTNYSFDSGRLKGLSIGGGLRWQQGVILGYALNAAKDNLDVDKPYWGGSTQAVDLWLAYSRKLTNRINWRVQLNTRNLGEQTHLERINAQPDGSAAGYRIVEGQTWAISNTFEF